MRTRHVSTLLILALGVASSCSHGGAPTTTPSETTTRAVTSTRPAPSPSASDGFDRTTLPIHEPPVATITELDARNVQPPPRFSVHAPARAPNVVIALIDDIGFGHMETFGGPIHSPTLTRLAENGLRYNTFHTTALCSPTRTALLTGRNHHSNNMGGITEVATGFPGNTGVRPQDITPVADILRMNGYATAAFGKVHEVAVWETSISGPFDRWPIHSGFDRFYGFLGGETNQWAPTIFDGTTRIEPPRTPNYHFTVDMTDRAVEWMRAEKSMTPDKPFFVYFATGATHAPHHPPPEYVAKYRGRFDRGWDAVRQETYERQLALGVIPQGTRLAAKPEAIRDWDTLSANEKRLFARQMEVYAGFAEHTDHEIGRVVDALEEMGELDNTLFLYIVGDNGSSAEGGTNGLWNENTYFEGVEEPIAHQLEHLDELGTVASYNHFASAWAVAGDTPFTWTKQVASNFGGTRNPLVVHWPARIREGRGGLRSQFHHVIDVAPTILEAASIPEPRTVNGIAQHPIEGVSMVYSFDASEAPSRHTTQYFEMIGNRAIYHDGWVAGTVHKAPWELSPRRPLTEDVWELYHVAEDFSESTNVAAENPAKLAELQALFLREAARYHVLPIDDRSIERLDPAAAGRPDLMAGRTSMTLYPGTPSMMENAFLNVKNRSFAITAEVDLSRGHTDGVILAQGGRFGGYALYVKNGRLAFSYNYVAIERTTVRSARALPMGHVTVRAEFAYDGGGRGKGGTLSLFVGDQKVGEAHIARTTANTFSLDEGVDVGCDTATPVSEDYPIRDNAFSGNLGHVTVELR